jgi:hypothetical protein
MEDKNAANIQDGQVAPAPVTPTTQVETKPIVSAPADNHAENKQTQAFIAMRKENREMKKKLAEVNANTPPAVAEEPVQSESVTVTPTTPKVAAPAPKVAVRDIEAESAKAIEVLANDRQISAVPGSILDIISMVDNDPRLSSLHNIDPTIAFREAKNLWLEKTGIAPQAITPKPTSATGGPSKGSTDLQALIEEAHITPPGTKRFNELYKKIQELRSKGN